MNKEKWTEDVLRSLDELQLVNPKENLYDEILSKLDKKEQATISISWTLSIAASFLILLILNVSFLNQNFSSSSTSEAEVLILQFENYSSNQLYEE